MTPHIKSCSFGEEAYGDLLIGEADFSRHKSHMRRFLGFWRAIFGVGFCPYGTSHTDFEESLRFYV